MDFNINVWNHPDSDTTARLDRIEKLIKLKGDSIMADIANLNEDLDAIKAGVQVALVAIEELKAQIAAIPVGAATQEQLDALDAKTEEIKSLLSPA